MIARIDGTDVDYFDHGAILDSQRSSFLWNARNELWLARSTDWVTHGWRVFDLVNETFSDSYMDIGTWTTFARSAVERTDGSAWFVEDTTTFAGELRSADGTLLDSFSGVGSDGGSGATHMLTYLPGAIFITHDNADAQVIYESSLEQAGIALDQVVEDICTRAGLDASQVDVTDLASDTVRGFVIERPMPGRSALEPLSAAFAFDCVESGLQLRFVKRGGASVATLTDADLGAHEAGGSKEPPPLRVDARAQEPELPAELVVNFWSQGDDYMMSTARARRLTTSARNVVGLDLPIVLTSEEANQIADRVMRQSWLERARTTIALGPRWHALEPTDPITMPDGMRVRITRSTIEPSGVMRCEAVSDDTGALISYAEGNTAPEIGSGVTISNGGISRMLVADTATLRDFDRDPGLYIGVCGERADWPGATVYLSRDGGVSWEGQTFHPSTTPARIGVVTSGILDHRRDRPGVGSREQHHRAAHPAGAVARRARVVGRILQRVDGNGDRRRGPLGDRAALHRDRQRRRHVHAARLPARPQGAPSGRSARTSPTTRSCCCPRTAACSGWRCRSRTRPASGCSRRCPLAARSRPP